MNAFYAALAFPRLCLGTSGLSKLTKAEALRQGQVALITNNYSMLGEQQRGIVVQEREGVRQ